MTLDDEHETLDDAEHEWLVMVGDMSWCRRCGTLHIKSKDLFIPPSQTAFTQTMKVSCIGIRRQSASGKDWIDGYRA